MAKTYFLYLRMMHNAPSNRKKKSHHTNLNIRVHGSHLCPQIFPLIDRYCGERQEGWDIDMQQRVKVRIEHTQLRILMLAGIGMVLTTGSNIWQLGFTEKLAKSHFISGHGNCANGQWEAGVQAGWCGRLKAGMHWGHLEGRWGTAGLKQQQMLVNSKIIQFNQMRGSREAKMEQLLPGQHQYIIHK